MFALVADDALYLKCDALNAAKFEDLGLQPFVYESAGKKRVMSYRQAPAEMYDDASAAIQWAQIAWEAALRAPARRAASPRKNCRP